MPNISVSERDFLKDRQGRTFADVVKDPAQPFLRVLEFFSDAQRQRRMEESETHHDRPPLAGVVRELEADPKIEQYLTSQEASRTKRLRQAVGVVVRLIMERRGWRKTGRKGSLGVRRGAGAATAQKPSARTTAAQPGDATTTPVNTGGLACWFLRAERYALPTGMPFRSVRERRQELLSKGRVAAEPPTARRRRVSPESPS